MKTRVAGGDLAYETRGSGPPVLFLHAFPVHMGMWEPQVRALAATHQAVRFDVRGLGGSAAGDGLLTMERIADDAAGLLDHLGLPAAVVCGLSMGGYAAFALLRRHPERIRGLVLASTRAGADSEQARRRRAELADAVRREGAAAAAHAFVPKLLGTTAQRERPEVVERVRGMVLSNQPRGICDALAGLAARADSTATLREVRVPTLVIAGAEDTVSPPAELEAIHRAIAGSRLVVLPRAGHLSNMEDPEGFNAALREFLAAPS